MMVTWSIVNNEMSFIKDVIYWHLPWIDAMYILDTGSTDGTLEYLQSLNHPKIIVEQFHTSFIPEYNKDWKEMKEPFPEVEVRNYALSRCEALFPGQVWLLQLDGDEIFMPQVKGILEHLSIDPNVNCIGHSTINPVEMLKGHPLESRGGKALYDPHVRIWKSGLQIKYMKNPAFKQQFHCIPVLNNKHLFHNPGTKFIDEIVHFHLHWMYGKKVESFFAGQQPKKIAAVQKTNCFSSQLPEMFWEIRKRWEAECGSN